MGKSTVDASAGFGLRDKLAYAAGDFGCNMSFALKGYLTIYWTQFMGIDNYLMASLLLIVQIWDAINDPIIGAMVVRIRVNTAGTSSLPISGSVQSD